MRSGKGLPVLFTSSEGTHHLEFPHPTEHLQISSGYNIEAFAEVLWKKPELSQILTSTGMGSPMSARRCFAGDSSAIVIPLLHLIAQYASRPTQLLFNIETEIPNTRSLPILFGSTVEFHVP